MQEAPNASKHSFLPYLFSCERKDRAAGGIRQSQICDDLSVSLRLTAPLKGEPCPLRRANPSGPSGQLPRMGSLGFRLTFPPDMAMMLGNPSEIMGNEGVVCMIREERLLGAFRELVSIDNPTLRERGVCDLLLRRYAALGIRLQEDGTGAAIGGNAGNLYAFVPGDEALAPVLLSAHTDAVSPACGKHAVFHPDGRITSDGTTVLGADDLAGQCAILEAVTSVLEDGAPHRPFELLFDAAEESYCTGIQRFDFSRLRAKLAYVFDLSGPVGGAAYQAPSILSFRAVFTGRAAHAAFSPEEGRHAIRAAAQAAAQIPCGRVGELTVNVGTIAGGTADNIVPDDLPSYMRESAGAPRVSRTEQSLTRAVEALEKSMLETALAEAGSTYKAARRLGISQSSVVRKAKKYGIHAEGETRDARAGVKSAPAGDRKSVV